LSGVGAVGREAWAGAAAIGRGFEQGRQRRGETLSVVGAFGRESWAGANKTKNGYIKCLYSSVVVPILVIVSSLGVTFLLVAAKLMFCRCTVL
jgi:hypothetical protein